MEIVPTELLPPAIPSTDQLTVWLEVPATVAENVTPPPSVTEAEGGLTVTKELTVTVRLSPLTFVLSVVTFCAESRSRKEERLKFRVVLPSEPVGITVRPLVVTNRAGSGSNEAVADVRETGSLRLAIAPGLIESIRLSPAH